MAQTRGYLHRRHDPHRRQQPDRLHDVRPARHARHALLHRHREDGRGADLPRQRRRSRGVPARDRDRDGLPAAVPPGRVHRSRLLPPPRAQRGRRADGHAAADVQEDRAASGHAQALRRRARCRRRDHSRRSRRDDRDLPRRDGQGLCTPTRRSCRTTSRRSPSTGRRYVGRHWTDARRHRACRCETLKALSQAADRRCRKASSCIRASRR